ncbi:hypothetical protein Clacol_005743 [Clathrus columnatus]|uniref:Nuclear pore complex protein Nup85 n=1 Tax=Clathrus columnatus TaxID=1419009 RepID=A0AAV5AF33_9AGAM|nr:hypothetical protein Clacol_005743 [Clathrus columnatus]
MTKFNKSLAEHRSGILDEDLSEDDLVWFNGIADEYLICLKMDKERLDDQDPWPEAAVAHTEILYAIFNLFQAMNLPANGSLGGLVGEELLEWLNTNFIAPDSTEAIELQKLNSPWDEDKWWQYLIRCILRGLTRAAVVFLESLKQHPSKALVQHAETLINFLTTHPRSTKFTTEHDFFSAWRQWKARVSAFRKRLEGLLENENEEWLSWVLEIVQIMEGDKATIKRYCESFDEGWKEAICVWGVWVDVGMRRHHIERTLATIFQDLPLDSTLPEEHVFAALFQSQVGEVIKRSNELDIWLAAHLADMMQPLGLLMDIEGAKISLRNHMILNYAEYLLVDPSLWRISALYMCDCGEQGKIRADEILLRVPLNLGISKGKQKTGHMEIKEDDPVDERVLEILEICKEYGREKVRREICRIAGRTFIDQGRYNLAISYYTSAEDWIGVSRVVDILLSRSLKGDTKEFIASVTEIAPTLRQPSSYSQISIRRRLTFLIKYAEFQTRWQNGDLQDAAWDLITMFREELVPKSWWGVLLKQAGDMLIQDENIMPFEVSEVYELLRRLEEVQSRASQGSGLDYLSALVPQVSKNGEIEALRQLETVRLALARYFARCSVLAVGGRGRILPQTA